MKSVVRTKDGWPVAWVALGGLVASAAAVACYAPVESATREGTGAPSSVTDGGGGGSREDARAPAAGDGAVGCADVPRDVLAARCATSGCHSAADKSQGLDLESPNVAARLVGVAAGAGPGLLIDPSAPSRSVVYTKLSASPPYGARMPFARTVLDDETTACVLAWVASLGERDDDAGAR